jgi:hypothetical protein
MSLRGHSDLVGATACVCCGERVVRDFCMIELPVTSEGLVPTVKGRD